MWLRGAAHHYAFRQADPLDTKNLPICHQKVLRGLSTEIGHQGVLQGLSTQICHQGALRGLST